MEIDVASDVTLYAVFVINFTTIHFSGGYTVVFLYQEVYVRKLLFLLIMTLHSQIDAVTIVMIQT